MNISIEKAKAFLEEKERKKKEMLDVLYDRAIHDFDAIKGMIINGYNPKRIYQWGSLRDRSKFREYSDIDIAVEGVNEPEQFFKIYGEAEKLTDFPLDLLDINLIEPEFADIIKQKGVQVYECEDQ